MIFSDMFKVGINSCVIDDILSRSGLVRYDIEKNNGRIFEKNHQKLIGEMYKNKDISELFLSSIPFMDNTLHASHQLSSNVTGLCLNEESIGHAISRHIEFASIISSCDDYLIHNNADKTMIEFFGFNPKNDTTDKYSVIGTIVGMLKVAAIIFSYSPEVSLHVGFINSYVPNKKIIDELFKTNCLLNQKSNFIIINNNSLNIKNNHFNKVLHKLQLDTAIQDKNNLLDISIGLTGNIKDLIFDMFLSRKISDQSDIINEICDRLKVSRWTLNRRLQIEGSSFTEILNQAKIDSAIKLLDENELSIQDISDFLCFSTNSALSRFFKAQTGETPLAYRLRQGG